LTLVKKSKCLSCLNFLNWYTDFEYLRVPINCKLANLIKFKNTIPDPNCYKKISHCLQMMTQALPMMIKALQITICFLCFYVKIIISKINTFNKVFKNLFWFNKINVSTNSRSLCIIAKLINWFWILFLCCWHYIINYWSCLAYYQILF